MRCLIAPDSFKESLPAPRVAAIIAEALRTADPAVETECLPLADGGEGTLDILLARLGGDRRLVDTEGPYGDAMSAEWGIASDGTALIETARCIGLGLVPTPSRRVSYASSRGVGMMLAAAATAGCTRAFVGLGGSATHDCGFGLAQLLGYEFFRHDGTKISPYDHRTPMAMLLRSVERILAPASSPAYPAEIIALADVSNPLTGPDGAAHAFARQKGAAESELMDLDEATRHFAAVVRRDVRNVEPLLPGHGAAGGLGFALAAFCGAPIVPGGVWIIALCGVKERLENCDLIITGEGRVDAQTMHGKLVSAVSAAAAAAGKPSVAFAGRVNGDAAGIARNLGLAALYEISPPDMSTESAIASTERLLSESVIAHAADMAALVAPAP